MEIRKYTALFFLWTGIACAQMQDPANLGRIGRPGVQIDGENSAETSIRPALSILGTYDSGFRRPALDRAGDIADNDGFGVTAAATVAGAKAWRRTSLSLAYMGTIRHYSKGSMDGFNQILALGVSRQLSRRVEISFSESLGAISSSFGIPGASPISFLGTGITHNDPNAPNLPLGEVFDTRAYFASTSADLAFYKSQRLTFGAGGSGFLIDRRARGLAGMKGANARGDVFYQLDRRQGIGFQYSYNHFGYTGQLGTADVHNANLVYMLRLDRRNHWTFRLGVGGYRIESVRLVSVALDPVIAALLGQSSGMEVFYGVRYSPAFSAQLSHTLQRSTLEFQISRTAVAGNGIYLASHQDLALTTYGYRLSRRLSSTISGSYTRMKSVSQNFPPYKSLQGRASLSFGIMENLHLTGYASYRTVDTNIRGGRLNFYVLGAGLTWSPTALRIPVI